MSNSRFCIQFHPRGYLAIGGKVTQAEDQTAFFGSKEEAIAAVRASVYSVMVWSVRGAESAERQEVEV